MIKRPGGALAGRTTPTKSQLLPVISNWREVLQKGYLVPGVLTVACVVALFAVPSPTYYFRILGLYITVACYYIFIYLLCGKAKPWWLLGGSAIATILILASPLLRVFTFIFRGFLPDDLISRALAGQTNFVVNFITMFFAAGLMEELLKAVPVFAIYYIGTRLRSPWRERIGVWEPLDGILLGAASGIGFTLYETIGEYVPKMFATVAAKHGEGAGLYMALRLLIPRVLDSVAGHMAYSGYFGYFIGLSALKPESRWQILGIGYVSAAAVHALWNSSGAVGPWLLIIVGSLTWACLAAAILKARQLSPTRAQNFATQVIGAGAAPQARFSLQVKTRSIGLYMGTKLREADIPGLKSQAGNGVIAEVNSNPNDATILGLKNLSSRAWTVTANGRTHSLNSGQSVRLVAGTNINFGPTHGTIV